MSRTQLTRGFLWVSILGWGIGLGAKLFDLLVVARAWGAAPPASLALMPYGSRYPMDPGDFFQPLSALMVVGILGALISGWKTRARPGSGQAGRPPSTDYLSIIRTMSGSGAAPVRRWQDRVPEI